MLALVTFCFSLLFSAVLSIPLVNRDVVVPHITSPHEGTVWIVGTKANVTWETDNLPPPGQITNRKGMVVLGFEANGSMNLQFDHPLAQGFDILSGSVTFTVPNVPPREDYLIVLFGDSGNASPAFAITSIRGGSNSSSSSSPSGTGHSPSSTQKGNDPSSSGSSDSTSTSSTPIDNSPPITGSTITGGASTPATVSAPEPTATSPILSTGLPSGLASQSPSTATGSGSAAAASTTTGAAVSVHSTKLWAIAAAAFAVTLLI